MSTRYDKGKKRKAQTAINEAKQELGLVKFDTLMVNNSNAAKALLLIAKQEHFDLIVVGSRGLGSRVSMILGSVSKNVAADAYCNVLVVKK